MAPLGRVARRWLSALGPLAIAAGSPPVAHANCVLPPHGLLWSYPANGAVDVPIDANLIVTGQLDGLPTIDGVPLEMLEPGVYDLGDLAPATRYEVAWSTAVIGFETGSETSRGAVPELAGSALSLTRNAPDAVECPLTESQGCFDTGPPTRVTFDASTGTRTWLVDVANCDGSSRTIVWPGPCGAPVIFGYDRIVCARLRATNGAVVSEATQIFCSVPESPLDSIPRSSSCTGAWPPEGAVTVAAADGVAVTPDGPDVTSAETAGADTASDSVAAQATDGGCALRGARPRGARAPGAALTGVLALLAARLWRTRRRTL